MMALLYRWRGFVLAIWAIGAVICGSGQSWVFWMFPCIGGILLRVWARRYIGMHTRGSSLAPARVGLSQGGPYDLIRHPLYLANVLLAWGVLLWWAGWNSVTACLGLFVFLFYGLLVQQEDSHLALTFRDDWNCWRARVRFAWIPCRIVPRADVAPQRSWWQAFRDDRWTWFWLVFAMGILSALRSFHVA